MNPFIGTFIGWILSFILGRVSNQQIDGITFQIVKHLIPTWAAGQTWGKIILIKKDCDWPSLRKHELVHTTQWKKLGWYGLGFIVAYLFESIKYGYDNNKYEIEAEAGESK